jgi:hypothetical protein
MAELVCPGQRWKHLLDAVLVVLIIWLTRLNNRNDDPHNGYVNSINDRGLATGNGEMQIKT